MRLFSLSLLLGTLLIQWIDILPPWQMSLPLLVFFIFLWFFLKGKNDLLDSCLLLSIAFSLGFTLASYHANQIIKQRIAPALEGKELLVTGKVINIPSVRDDGVRFLFDVYSAEPVTTIENNPKANLTGIIRLGWFKSAEDIQSGELWQLKVKLKKPSGFMNPGGFDYEKWLFTQRIIATGYVRESKNTDKSNNQNIKLNQSSNFKTADYWRQSIHQFIQSNISNESSAAVLSALLVAVRDKLDDEQWQVLQATGTSHLIAISGLHIAVVAGFAFFPIMLLWRLFPRLYQHIPVGIAGAVVGTIFAIIYAILAGFTLPTQRALLMVMIGLWGLVSRRNYDSFTILALALILVLLWDPLAAMSISFWLSFLAVFLILFFIKRQKQKPSWMVIKIQIFISLAMLPLTLLFFGTASFTSPIANLFAIPWVSLVVVPIALLALLFMPFSSYLTVKLLEVAAIAIDLLFKGLELIGGSALSQITFSEFPSSLLVVTFIGLLFLFLPKGFPARWLGLLLFIPLFLFDSEKPRKDEFSYTLLDVGQGYASVLQTSNHTLIYDTGVRISDSFDMGKLVIAPFLNAKGIEKINTMMISHEDIDHRGGAQYLNDHFSIDKILSSDTSLLDKSDPCVAGLTWQWDGVNFKVLSPPRYFIGNDNNRSCVLKVWNQHHSILLTGDIQKQTEKALILSHPEDLKSDVMSVPHHGSKTSSTNAFLEAIAPDVALVSAGYRSRFGHPKPSIVDRYKRANIELLDTVALGAITLHFPSDTSAITREYYRKENTGIWSRKLSEK